MQDIRKNQEGTASLAIWSVSFPPHFTHLSPFEILFRRLEMQGNKDNGEAIPLVASRRLIALSKWRAGPALFSKE